MDRILHWSMSIGKEISFQKFNINRCSFQLHVYKIFNSCQINKYQYKFVVNDKLFLIYSQI